VPFYVDPDGKLHAVQPLGIDIVSGNFSFHTYHASFFTWIFGNTAYAPGIDDIFYTGFSPERDGFQVVNADSMYKSGGECLGMTSFSLWYFKNKKESIGDFYPKYYDLLGIDFERRRIRPQNIIASRAFISIAQKWGTYSTIVENQKRLPSDKHRYEYIRTAMLNTESPVLLYLYKTLDPNSPTHSVLAYGSNHLDGNIFTYNPNNPGKSETIHYNLTTNIFDIYSGYDGIVYNGDDFWDLAEPYQNILDDAENNFQGSWDAIITLTSHEYGQQVTNKDINLIGIIESGLVLVSSIEIRNGPESDFIDVDGDGFFNTSIELQNGINNLQFITTGSNFKGCPVFVFNNMFTEDTSFVLYYDPPPISTGQDAPTEEIKDQFEDCYSRNGGGFLLSNPTSKVYPWHENLAQNFSNSNSCIIYSYSQEYAYLVQGEILEKYLDNIIELGLPISEQETGAPSQPKGTTCKYQNFENGAIEVFENGEHQGQAFVILNPFFQKWAELGYADHNLGYPIEDRSGEVYSYYAISYKYQNFEGGALEYDIYLDKVVEIHGAIYTKWKNLNYAQGTLGMPMEDEQEAVTSPISDFTGRYSVFEGGIIYWVRDEDRISVIGFKQPGAKAIAEKHHNKGGSGGDLGFPTSDDYGWNGGVRVNFENGYIHWTEAGGAVRYTAETQPPDNPVGRGAPTEEIKNQFIDCYDRNGGEAVLSNPTADVYSLNGYWAQNFSDSTSIIVYNSPLKYAYLVKEPILSKYSARTADLGPPVSGQGTGDFSQPTQQVTRCKYQNFENGAIEVFENGVYQNQAFVILNPFFQKWAALGYANHDLGYPIEDQSEELTSYFGTRFKYQNFEGGAPEYLIDAGKVVEIHGAIFTKWKNLNYAQSHLGLPTEDEQEAATSPVSGWTGRYSVFEGGVIHWIRGEDRISVIGFEQPGAKAISDKYHAEGGSGGNLGFPTSDDYWWNGGVRVDFENGYIHWTEAEGAVKYLKQTKPITINFTAQVTRVRDVGNLLGGTIEVDDIIIGQYTYDPTTPDCNEFHPIIGLYQHFDSPFGIKLKVKELVFETDPNNVEFFIEIINDHETLADEYLLRSRNNRPLPGGIGVDNILWYLHDPTATALNVQALPIGPPVLENWQSTKNGLFIVGPPPLETMYYITAQVTSVAAVLGENEKL